MRVCKECKIEKELIDFPLKKNGKIKSSYCKKCYIEVYYYLNLENVKNYKKKYYEDNKEEIIKKSTVFYQVNRLEINKKRRKNIIRLTEEERKEKSNKKSLEYYYLNKEKQNKKTSERNKLRMLNDSKFKLSHNIRVLIRKSLQNQFTTKSKKTIEILGCSFDEFKIHLESQFDAKMNWENQGTYWHMDHIIPISSAETEEDVYRLNHYTNFQPLYWLDNLKKSNKIK
jgi:hypothetical protein